MNFPLNKIIAVMLCLLAWIGGFGIACGIAWLFGAPPEFFKYLGIMLAGAAAHDAFGEWRTTL